MRVARFTLAGALIALSPVAALAVDSAAYPKAPGNMPAADDNGKPVESKTDAGARPPPAANAGTERAPDKTGTPSTAYPGAPTNQPASGDGGRPVRP